MLGIDPVLDTLDVFKPDISYIEKNFFFGSGKTFFPPIEKC
jgi:hypothetical protein